MTDRSGKEIENWKDLSDFIGYSDFIFSHKSSLLDFWDSCKDSENHLYL